MTAPQTPEASATTTGASGPNLTITVCGSPAPQGSKRHVGKGVMVESSKAAKPWREDVKNAALNAIDNAKRRECWAATLDGPLAVSMTFTIKKPTGAPKTKRTWPDRKPDISKLARATEDALTDAGVWADDARVVQYDRLAKAFPGEDTDALNVPGAVIRIWQLGVS